MTAVRWPAPLVSAVIWLTAAALALAPVGWEPVRAAITLPALLVLPGWVMMRALYPGGRHLDWAARMLLTVGLSIVVLILIGLVLDIFAGLRPASWAVGVGAAILVAEGVAALRSRRAPDRSPTGRRTAIRLPPAPVLAAGIVGLVVVVASLALSSRAARRQHYPPFTQLWMTHRGDTYTIGVRSFEDHTARYRLVIERRGATVATHDILTLVRGQTWSIRYVDRGGARPLRAVLLREGRRYRYVVAQPPCGVSGSQGVCTRAELRAATRRPRPAQPAQAHTPRRARPTSSR